MDTITLRNRLALLLALGALGAAPALQAAASAPPQAVDDSINTAEGTPGDTNVLANDLNGATGTLRIAEPKRPQAIATLEGTVDGRPLRATMPAP